MWLGTWQPRWKKFYCCTVRHWGNAHQTHVAGRHYAKKPHLISRLHVLAYVYIHLSQYFSLPHLGKSKSLTRRLAAWGQLLRPWEPMQKAEWIQQWPDGFFQRISHFHQAGGPMTLHNYTLSTWTYFSVLYVSPQPSYKLYYNYYYYNYTKK